MTLNSMSESGVFQLEQYFKSNPYREYAMNRPYVPISTHSHRLNKPSTSIIFHSLINNDQKNLLTLDRINYKLRMKSNLNVDTLRDIRRTNSNNNDTSSLIPRSATTKTFIRQPTGVTRTTDNNQFNGIEGNAVRVATVNDLIQQFHLIHHPTDYLDNISTYTSNTRTTLKPPLFPSARIIRQPQALTEYHFHIPNSSRNSSQADRYRINQNINPNSSKNQSTIRSSYDKRIQESREKTLMHTEKQLCFCHKLTIIDPYNSEQNQSIIPSIRYIFPPVRSSGYFTRKRTDLAPFLLRKKYETKKLTKNSLVSSGRSSIDDGKNSPLLNDSIISTTDLDEDLENPPNTIINLD